MIYAIAYDYYGPIKIGKSTNLQRRIAEIQTGCHKPLVYWIEWAAEDERDNPFSANIAEQVLQDHFKEKRLHGEWFDISFRDLDALPCRFHHRNRIFSLDQIDISDEVLDAWEKDEEQQFEAMGQALQP